MKYVYAFLSWSFGLLFALAGIGALFTLSWTTLPLLAMAALLLPPVRKWAYEKSERTVEPRQRGYAMLALFLAFGVIASAEESHRQDMAERKEAAEQAQRMAEAREKRRSHFESNRDSVLADIQAKIDAGEFRAAVAEAKKYLMTQDKQLLALRDEAQAAIDERQKQEKTENILARLKKIPAENYEANKNLYGQLAQMHPDNETYKSKRDYYAKKFRQAEQERKAAAARQKRIEAQFSGWDGSHRTLERLIKANMHNPDSYEHVETVYGDRGDHLMVKTTYRGTNGFGAIVTNSITAKVDLDGNVLEIVSQN